ncbi:MAG: hypothetical protein Q8L36_01045 [bacterium]|nr:hypothetical protein [bacterium]
MFLVNILLIVAVLFGVAINGLAVEPSSIFIGVVYGKDSKTGSLRTDLAENVIYKEGTVVNIEKWRSDSCLISIGKDVQNFWVDSKRLRHQNRFSTKGPMILNVKATVFWLKPGAAPDQLALKELLKQERDRRIIEAVENEKETKPILDEYDLRIKSLDNLPLDRVPPIAGELRLLGGHPAYAERQPAATPLDTALAIMSAANVFDVSEAAAVFGIDSADAAAKFPATVPFSEATLRECASTHFLVADLGLSIEEMKNRNPDAFSENWSNSDSKAAQEKTQPQWRLIRKAPRGSDKSSCREIVYNAILSKIDLKGFVKTASSINWEKFWTVGNPGGKIWIYPGQQFVGHIPESFRKYSAEIL